MEQRDGAGSAPATAAAPKFKLSMGGAKSSLPHSTLSKRPHSMLDDVTPADVPESTAEQISHFGAAGSAREPDAAPRVIQSLPNRNWREESARSGRKRQKNAPPSPEDAEDSKNGGTAPRDVVNGDAPAGGLTVFERKLDTTAAIDNATPPAETGEDEQRETKEKTIDEQALDALTGRGGAAVATLAIAPPSPPPTEDEAFRKSYADAPPPATLEQYDATPVEGYGAAILRGYLKKGQTLESLSNNDGKTKPGEMKRRPGLLGLGAKESGLGIELGAWGKSARKDKKGDDEAGYMPLALKNKKTGEVLTEEELKEKLKEQSDREANGKRSKTDSEDDRRRRDRREGDRSTEKEGDSSRDRSSREQRSTSSRSYKSRRHERDDSYSSRRREERGKERNGHRDEYSSRDRDRHDKTRRDHERRDDSRSEGRSGRELATLDSRESHRDGRERRDRERSARY